MKVKVLSRSHYDYMRETKHDIHKGLEYFYSEAFKQFFQNILSLIS